MIPEIGLLITVYIVFRLVETTARAFAANVIVGSIVAPCAALAGYFVYHIAIALLTSGAQ